MAKQISDPSIFTIGGTVQAGPGIYITRKADDELFDLCLAGMFAYVLTARQMGKSSLMVRTAEHLISKGVKSVTIDLTKIGAGQEVTAEKWYLGILVVIKRRLGLKTDIIKWWQDHSHLTLAQRLSDFFEDILLVEITEPIVIFIDEVDTTLRLSFTDDFYAAIRYLYNERARVPAFKRLSFVLIGVATPSDLIHNPDQTPFNIGQRVELADFTFEEALPLAHGFNLPPDLAQQVLRWMLSWTNGHPYLTQRLCRAIANQESREWSKEGIDRIVANTFFGDKSEQDNNLQFVRDMLTERARELEQVDPADILITYQAVYRNRPPVRDEEQSLTKSHLKLSGVVSRENSSLSVRNPIYREVFNERWIKEHLPPTWTSRQLKRARWAAVGLAAVLLIVSSLAVYAAQQKFIAEATLSDVEQQKQLAEDRRTEAEWHRATAERAFQQVAQEKSVAEEQRANAQRAAAREEAERRRAERGRREADRLRHIAELRSKMDRNYRDGVDAYFKEELPKAINEFNSALEHYKDPSIDDKQGQAVTLSNIAQAFFSLGKNKEAIEHFEKASAAYNQIGDSNGVASALIRLGNVYRRDRQGEKAIGCFEKSLGIYRKNKDEAGEVKALQARAVIYEQSLAASDEEEPDTSLDKSKEKASENKISSDQEKAIDSFSQLAEVYRKSGNSEQEATALIKIGNLYVKAGDQQKAIEHFTQAAGLYRKSGNSAQEADAIKMISKVHERAGDQQKALEYLDNTVTLYREASADMKEAATLQEIAGIYRRIGDRQKALEQYQKHIQVYLRAYDSRLKDRFSYYNKYLLETIGRWIQENSESRHAIEYFSQLAELHRKSNNSHEEANTLRKLGELYEKANDQQKALEQFLAAAKLYEPDALFLDNTLASIVRIYLKLDETEKALEYLDRAIRVELKPSPDGSFSETLAQMHFEMKAIFFKQMAEIYLKRGDLQKAAHYLDQSAQVHAKFTDELDTRAEVLKQAGDIYIKLGDSKKSLERINQAIEIYRQDQDKENESGTLIYVGAAHLQSGDLPKASEYFNRSIEVYRQANDINGEAGALTEVGKSYQKFSDQQKALEYLIKAAELHKQAGNKAEEASVRQAASKSFFLSGQKQKAIDSLREAYSIYEEEKEFSGSLRPLISLLFVYSISGDSQQALDQLNKALILYQTAGSEPALPLPLESIPGMRKQTK